MPCESMSKSGPSRPAIDQERGVDTAPSSFLQKESSYYMDNYEATVTVHASPPQYTGAQTQSITQSSAEYLEIDDETRDIPSKVARNKLSKKKNLRVTFSDHIEVDLIEDLYDDVDGDVSDDLVIEETIYELVKAPGSNKLSRGNVKLKEPYSFQSPKPLIIGHGSPELKLAKENVSPNKSPPGSPKRSERRVKVNSPKSNKVTSQSSSSPTLLQRRKLSQSSMTESEKTTKHYLHELRERRQSQTQKINLNTLFPNLGQKTRTQPNNSNFLSDCKRAVDRANSVNDNHNRRRSPEKPVYGLYSQTNSDMRRSATGSVRKTTSLPRNFRLPETLYSGRYRRPSSESTLLTSSNLGVK